jgi:hypothetical protein
MTGVEAVALSGRSETWLRRERARAIGEPPPAGDPVQISNCYAPSR